MSSSPKIYRSSDSSAPVLTGQNGALTALLYACLVTGYGAKSALGWTREYDDAGNYTSVYKQGAGPGHYLRVDDGGPGAGTTKEARAVGYESMSGVDTGTAPFPTAAQAANGVFLRKSVTADATARDWILIGTNKLFYLFIYNGDVAAKAAGFGFGSAYSIVPGEAYGTFIAGRSTENSAAASYEGLTAFSAAIGTATIGNYMVRDYTGVGSGVTVAKFGGYYQTTQTWAGYTSNLPYPNPIDGSFSMSPINFATSGYYRGTLPGLWNPMHNVPLTNGDTLAGVGGLSSRTFEAITIAQGQVLIETSNTWDEN